MPADPEDRGDDQARVDQRARNDRLREELLREHRIPVHGDRPHPPSTAERFFPQARPDSLAREELGDTDDDGWYAAEPPSDDRGWPADDHAVADEAWAAGQRWATDDGLSTGRPQPPAKKAPRRSPPGDERRSARTPRTNAAGSTRRPAAGSDESADGRAAGAARPGPDAAERAAAGPKNAAHGPGQGAPGPTAQAGAEGVAGPDLARAVLDAALARRQQNQQARRRSGTGTGSGKRLRGYSGPGPDPRDPQLFGAVLERLMKARGWERPKAEATVFGAWEKVVGPEIAQHSRPVKLDAGVLTVEAESTAWATQLRLLAATLLRNIAGEVGHNVVTRLNIHGPAAPSWAKGPRRVQGRGPRDTYG